MDDFNVVVQAGVMTLLPNGCAITIGGSGAIIEVLGYQNSGEPVDVGPGTRVWHRS